MQEIVWEGVDWIDLAQSMEKWRAFVHMVMNLCIPQNVGNYFRITNEILVCEELCSMELNSYIIVGWLVGWLVSVNYITAKIRVLFITPS